MNEKIRMQICNELRNMRQTKGLSQQDLADRLRIPRTTYCGYEVGRRDIDIENLAKVCDICGFDRTEVFNRILSKVYK